MVTDSEIDDGPEADSDLRRRAAWLLGMLAIVAVLFVVIMSQLVGGSSGGNGSGGPRALDSAVGSRPTPSPSSAPAQATHSRRPSSSSAPTTGTSARALHGTKCPTQQPCVVDGDPGNGIAAINLYRTQNGQDAVVGRVSNQAQQCALNNGNGCSGGWAETELAKPDGPAAVQKILPFAHLLDPMKNFTVGWAYDPGAKLYYFAIIRNG